MATATRKKSPKNGELGITINFERGKSNPTQIFEAMTLMLESFNRIDEILVDAIDEQATTQLVLEAVEAASITSWVRNKIASIDDDALKKLNWRDQVGAYLVTGKYKVLEFLDHQIQNEKAADLPRLAAQLEELGIAVPPRSTLFHRKIEPIELVEPLNQIQTAKQLLNKTKRSA